MPLGSGNIVQTSSGNTGGSSAMPSITVTVSSATTGNTVLIGVCAGDLVTTPAGFLQDAHVTEGRLEHYVFRKQASTGETSWTVTFAASAIAAYWVEEVSGLDASAPLVAGISNGTTSAVSTISTTSTPAVSTTDVVCYASFAEYNTATTTITWSGYTNSFTEIHDTSAASAPDGISIAEARLFPGTSGSFTTTATLSATADDTSAVLVVYQASSAPVTVVDNVSVGGTFPITAKVTSRSSGNTFLDLYTAGTTVQGSVEFHSDLSVTGTLNYATSAIGVTSTSVTFTVGDVVQSASTGECMVVRDSWTGTGGPMWSNTTDRSTQYATSGWSVIGSATIS